MARGGGHTSRSGKGDFRFTIQISPDPRELRDLFRTVGEQAIDFRPIWAKVAHTMSSGIVRNIHSQGGSLDEPWPNEDKDYAERKKLLGHGSRRLVYTGKALSRMLTTPILSRSKARVSVGYRGRKWGYLPAINFGQKGALRGMLFMGWSPQMQREATSEMLAHIDRVIASATSKFSRGK